jgi:hypothetical protein
MVQGVSLEHSRNAFICLDRSRMEHGSRRQGPNAEVMSLRAIFPLCVVYIAPSFHLLSASSRPYQPGGGAVVAPMVKYRWHSGSRDAMSVFRRKPSPSSIHVVFYFIFFEVYHRALSPQYIIIESARTKVNHDLYRFGVSGQGAIFFVSP